MRVFAGVVLVGTLFAAACGSASPAAPTAPGSAGSGSAATLTGAWAGTASDSTGSMMGSGMSGSMMSNMTWNIVQTGNTFTGTMQFAGYHGGQMTVSGTINGSTVTFTMTMPAGSMMGTVTCTATATGTLDLNALMTDMHGNYGGSNSCTGPFDHGQISMTRR